ncbi:thioester-containing protein 1 allele S3-like [Oppia nitens]|uniref:thioester-containing protein 1 allele S3-like n=1 Tax=Oppia nitens TaxID=1686743 RepID=UPI0023DA1ED4|nr:thioester-containing protein 1 allele S3-like [Oppia nitens]
MKVYFNIFLNYCLFQIIIYINLSLCANKFAITGPTNIERWISNKILVNLYEWDFDNTMIIVDINSKIDTGIKTSQNKTYTLKTPTPDLTFDFTLTDQWPYGGCTATITGLNAAKAQVFSQTMNLNMINSKYQVLVQSSSDVYSPGENVMFRVIVLNEKFQKIDNKVINKFSISLTDPSDFDKQYMTMVKGEINTTDNYYQSFFNLSNSVTNDIIFNLDTNAPEGTWSININIDNTNVIYKFLVSQYQTQFANYVTNIDKINDYRNPKVNLSIDVKYDFMENVHGQLMVNVTKDIDCDKQIPIKCWVSNFNDFDTQLDFSTTPMLNPKCDNQFNVYIQTIDNFTRQVYHDKKIIKFTNVPINVVFLNANKQIKPGLNFKVFIKFSLVDTTKKFIYEQFKSQLKIIPYVNNNNTLTPVSIASNDDTMMLEFRTDTSFTNIVINVTYYNNIIAKQTYIPISSCVKTFLTTEMTNALTKSSIGDEVLLTINSNENIAMLKYYFVVNNKIYNASTVNFTKPNTVQNFLVVPDKYMAPVARFVAMFYSPTSDTLATDFVDLYITPNDVSNLKLTTISSNKTVNNFNQFTVESAAKSSLVLFAGHKLINGYQIQEFNVINQINEIYNQAHLAMAKNPITLSSQITLLSNTIAKCVEVYASNEHDIDPYDPDYDKIIYNNNGMISSTLVWDKMQINSNKVSLEATIPSLNNGKWEISAMSIDDDNGFSISKQTLLIYRNSSVYMEINIDYNIKQNAQSQLDILIYNSLDDDINAIFKLNETTSNQLNPKIKFDQCHFNVSLISKKKILKTCYIVDMKDPKITFNQIINLNYFDNIVENSVNNYLVSLYDNNDKNWFNQIDDYVYHGDYNFLPFDQKASPPCNTRFLTMVNHVYMLSYMATLGTKSQPDIDNVIAIIKLWINNKCILAQFDGSIASLQCTEVTPTGANRYSSTIGTIEYLKMIKLFRQFNSDYNNEIYYTSAWLKRQQLFTGEFLERDPNQIVKIPPSSFPGAYITAHAYIALVDDNEQVVQMEFYRTLEYLATVYPRLTNSLDKILACYALHLGQHINKDVCFEDILPLIKSDNQSSLYVEPDTDPEASIYMLHLLAYRKHYQLAIKFVKYLKLKEKSDGSITDGIPNIHARNILIKLMREANNFKNIDHKVTVNINNAINYTVNQANGVPFVHKLNADIKQINITSNGFGKLHLYLIQNYNNHNELNNTQQTNLIMCNSDDKTIKYNISVNEFILPKGVVLLKNQLHNIYMQNDKQIIVMEKQDLKQMCYSFDMQITSDYKQPKATK